MMKNQEPRVFKHDSPKQKTVRKFEKYSRARLQSKSPRQKRTKEDEEIAEKSKHKEASPPREYLKSEKEERI